MHTLAFVNQKGGCGKTTTAVNLAGALAAGGAEVLLVDLDPQAHATLGLGCGIEDEPTLTDVLVDGLPITSVIHDAPGEIDLVPALPSLASFEDVAERRIEPEQTLRRAFRLVSQRYDYAILDCPPRTDGVLAANALRAADTAVLVVECGAFALQGALKALEVLEEVAADMERPFDLRVVCTLFDRRTRFAREVLLALHARFGELAFDTPIRTSIRLRECAAVGLPVQALDPGSRAASDFASLAREVRAHVERGENAPRGERESRPARSRPAARARPAGAHAGGEEWTP